jgi:alkyl hydroperoxide reductase subunit AhpF
MLVFDGAFFTTIGRNRLVSMHFVFTDASYDRRLVLTEREYRNDGLLPRCDGPLLERKPVVSIGGGKSGLEANSKPNTNPNYFD